MTKNFTEYQKRKIYLLSGKNTGRLGVVSKSLSNGDVVEVTGIERTLIDAVVRPAYCGGIGRVHEAFRNAKGKVTVSLLSDTLNELDYLCPYHQAIGFLLDRAGVFSDSEIAPFLDRPRELDFYLEHKMSKPKYSSRWRICYPNRLDVPTI